ncbi:hypothetical protein G3N30_07930 [Microbacterium lacticum]|nr:hypothetical protein [Microbacterium lacticum]
MDSMMMNAMSDDMMMMDGMAAMDMAMMQACMDACAACEQACTVCSTQLMDCATSCMNGADMCGTMMRTMLRMQGMTPPVMMAMLDACIAMCQMCEDECRAHAEMSPVCAMCADACRACMEACMAVKSAMAA